MDRAKNLKKWLPFVVFLGGMSTTVYCQPSELVNAINYGVPTSPAFELLPSKPSETSNVVTASDFYTTVPSFISNGKLKTGVAADIRPFSYIVGNLQEYQNNKAKQILWRTVLAVGTAPSTTSNDTYASFGIRTSLFDKGDPRSDSKFTNRLESAYSAGLGDLPPPPLGLDEAGLQARALQAGQATAKGMLSADAEQKKITEDSWNKFKLDVGGAFMLKALEGSFRNDSLISDRWGVWVASGMPVFKKRGQASATLKSTRSLSSGKKETETARHVLAGRIRYFVSGNLSISGELAGLWSQYKKSDNLDESWGHFAIIAEVKVPWIGGWLNLAYGGDSNHRSASASKFSFSYAVSANRIIKKL